MLSMESFLFPCIECVYSFAELRKNLEHLKRTQVDNKGASTTLVKNNIASFMEAVDIMKGEFIIRG